MIHLDSLFPWISWNSKPTTVSQKTGGEPLREFVYLDEVSLASLLASQKGELTENITAQSAESFLAEASGKIGTTGPLLPTAEATSRFQTTNSSTLQTVRKANAQSLFRELHKLEHLRKIQPLDDVTPVGTLGQLVGVGHKASNLQRGDLVEFRVRLSASWIFQISTIVAEFSDMFDESPALFVDHVKFSDLYQAKNANKIISRLLAGLVPIDGLAPDYAVVRLDDDDYIIHKDAISQLDIESIPLQIVGVTEHLAYWKDIRRILFADNEFTMLCRLSKPGIQDDWNPIKVADIFSEFAPDLAKQIEDSSRIAMAQSLDGSTRTRSEPKLTRLMLALARYKGIILELGGNDISAEQSHEIDRAISDFPYNAETVEGQRAAFLHVKGLVHGITGRDIDPSDDLAAREQARVALALPLFTDIPVEEVGSNTPAEPILERSPSRLLDVEVVAIYW